MVEVSGKRRETRSVPLQTPRGPMRETSTGVPGRGAGGASTAADGGGGAWASAGDDEMTMPGGTAASAESTADAGGLVSRWRRVAARRILKTYITIMRIAKTVR